MTHKKESSQGWTDCLEKWLPTHGSFALQRTWAVSGSISCFVRVRGYGWHLLRRTQDPAHHPEMHRVGSPSTFPIPAKAKSCCPKMSESPRLRKRHWCSAGDSIQSASVSRTTHLWIPPPCIPSTEVENTFFSVLYPCWTGTDFLSHLAC